MQQIKMFTIKAGKQNVEFQLWFSGSNWNVCVPSMDNGIVIDGFDFDGKIGVHSFDKSIVFFRDQIIEIVKKEIKKFKRSK